MDNLTQALQGNLEDIKKARYTEDVHIAITVAKKKADRAIEDAEEAVENVLKDMSREAEDLKLQKSDFEAKKFKVLESVQTDGPEEFLKALGEVFTEEEAEELAVKRAKIKYDKISTEIETTRNLLATNLIDNIEEIEKLENPILISVLYKLINARCARTRFDHIDEFLFGKKV